MAMNGFNHQGLSEDDFGPSGGISALRSFDAFPKTKTTYLTRTRNGSVYTVLLIFACIYLTSTEVWRFLVGKTAHTFSVEKGVEHHLQINVDVVVAMRCEKLHVNVQDASGDRILAGDKLKKDPTRWSTWDNQSDERKRMDAGLMDREVREQYRGEDDVHEFLAKARGRKGYKRTPKLKAGQQPDACRVYGNLDGNKVQGDFHITARGHGYVEMGDHLDHSQFNFTHHINELSFGPFIPSLVNPLDATQSTTLFHFYKYQYYLSIVPTIYTDVPHKLTSSTPPRLDRFKFGSGPAPNFYAFAPHTLFTNQYAVTEQSHTVGENAIPGIFVKYDIEPILLTVSEEWGGILGLLVKVVNVVAGVMVAGSWLVALAEWASELGVFKRARRRAASEGGLLHGKKEGLD